MLNKVFLIFISFFSLASQAFSLVLEAQVEGDRDSNFIDAQFRLWVPDHLPLTNSPAPETVLCYISGSGMNALGLADDAQWQTLASRLNAYFLTIHFRDTSSGKSWHLAEVGTGQALIDALKTFSKKAGIPELETMPLALVGLSTGGQYAYHWACWKPEQVRCFITFKGGHHQERYQPQVLKVPALWVTGSEDMEFRQKNIQTVFKIHQAAGAPWILVVEPKMGHASDKVSSLIESYLRSVLKNNGDGDLEKKNSFGSVLDDFLKGTDSPLLKPLPMNAKPLPDYATINVASLDFGECPSGAKPKPLEIILEQKLGAPSWNRVVLADQDQCWEVLSSTQEVGKATFSLRFKPRLEPVLGLTKTEARFRFYKGEKQHLGGINLPATVRVTGDVVVTPLSLYFGSLSGQEKLKKNLTIKSKGNHPIKWKTALSRMPAYLQVKVLKQTNEALILSCELDPAQARLVSENGNLGDPLELCVFSNQQWMIKVPLIFSVSP